MKNTICEIYLNPNGHCNGVYHSGQKLSGNVVLTFYEKQRIKSMFWSFCILSDYFVSCVNFSIYSLWSLQILWFKFSASANVNGMKRADHIMAKKFISKMKLKSQNLLKVCKILLNESVDIFLIFLVLKIQKKNAQMKLTKFNCLTFLFRHKSSQFTSEWWTWAIWSYQFWLQ